MLFLPIAHQLMKAGMPSTAVRTLRVYYCVTTTPPNNHLLPSEQTNDDDVDGAEKILSVAIKKALMSVLGLHDEFPVLMLPMSRPSSYPFFSTSNMHDPNTNPTPNPESSPAAYRNTTVRANFPSEEQGEEVKEAVALSCSLCAHFLALDFRKLNAEVWIRDGHHR